MVKPLTVYKASAGSGKTFTLATEYIKLVVQNPMSYRNILAVTFTNKATEEMKMRILSQLYGIWKQLPDSSSYISKVCSDLDASPEFVSRQAGMALSNLLHNYSYFRVETIDTFFQSVLRNLARELELTANLRVGLNDSQVEELAVDQLIEDLSTTDTILQWIMRYIMENIEDNRSWNVIGHIKSFGKTIFRDYYKRTSRELNGKMREKGFFEHYTKTLRDIRRNSLEYMSRYADTFFDTLEAESLSVDDLSYGRSGVASFFLKLRNGQFDESVLGKRVLDCLDDPAKWYKKSHPRREVIHALADGPLGETLRTAVFEQPRQWKLYKSADLTLRHLNQLRLLDSIEQKVNELNSESNRFLLSNTQDLLHSLILDSDSPFIFEKMGTQLEHIMIDEFQDTSVVQWQNFKVLLQECMSHRDAENLIVGDVKQSIYRWRSGDWRLLNDIEREFPHPDLQLQVKTLDTNYRSDRNIVCFNNRFFSLAAQLEELDNQAYADVCQQVPASKPAAGLIDIKLLPAEDYEEATLREVEAIVDHLRSQHVSPSRIACLLRTNSLITLIARYFMENRPDVNVVSDEAFRLDASLTVNLIVGAMRLIAHPDDQLTRAYLAKSYQQQVLHNPLGDNELLLRSQSPDDLLPESFTAHLAELRALPLYELAERLYQLFGLSALPGQGGYYCTFLDVLNSYLADHPADIDDVLAEWDSNLRSTTIQSDEVDGLRLISIHKSKGLEFDHVIIPFCDWQLEKQSGNIIWCQPTEAPFSELPLVPVDFSKKQLAGTIYEPDYQLEHMQNTVDNLNLLYVAFTRASHNLFVLGKRKTKASRSAVIEQVITSWSADLEAGAAGADRGDATGGGWLEAPLIEGVDDNSLPLHFRYGTLSVPRQDTDRNQDSANAFLQNVAPLQVAIGSYNTKTEFRQSNQSRNFVAGDDDDEASQSNYIQLGNVLHQVFSNIRTADDVDTALQQLQQEGILYDASLTPERIGCLIRRRLADPRVASWFGHGWTLFNECAILYVDPDTKQVVERRPDRVMTDGRQTIVVDFKFGKPREEYHDQVRHYMQLLTRMGYPQVSGFLWFVYSNRIVEVSLGA